MAITIISNFTSGKYYPSANPINCTVNSNNSGKCNFRYICDVYINNIKVHSDKLFPDPTTGYGFFQLSRIIEDYIKTSLPKEEYLNLIEPASTTTAPAAALTLQCKFGEEYDLSTDCKGTIVQYLNLSTSNTFYVFESAFDYQDFPTYDYNEFLIGTASSTTDRFLTNSPKNVEVTFNDSYYLDFLTNLSTSNFVLNFVITYKNGTTTTKTYTRTLTGYRRYRLAVGPFNINAYDSDTTINMNVDYYDVYLKAASPSTQVTEAIRFKVKDPKTFKTRIGFVGLLGGLEHFTFYHRNRAGYSIERKTYEKLLQSNYAGAWSYEVGDRGTTTFAVNAREAHTVASYCDVDTSKWLYEMWLSPTVWTYIRPELYTFQAYADGSQVKLFVEDGHGIAVGDDIFIYSENSAFTGQFAVSAVSGNHIYCGMLTSVYGADLPACGYIQLVDTWHTLPIVISDNTVEVKQKMGRPIEYQLNYAHAFNKTTLRG